MKAIKRCTFVFNNANNNHKMLYKASYGLDCLITIYLAQLFRWYNAVSGLFIRWLIPFCLLWVVSFMTTLAQNAPGGVKNGLRAWFLMDKENYGDGQRINRITEKSGNSGISFTNSNLSRNPIYEVGNSKEGFNFNPVMKYNNNWLKGANGKQNVPYTDEYNLEFFYVLRGSGVVYQAHSSRSTHHLCNWDYGKLAIYGSKIEFISRISCPPAGGWVKFESIMPEPATIAPIIIGHNSSDGNGTNFFLNGRNIQSTTEKYIHGLDGYIVGNWGVQNDNQRDGFWKGQMAEIIYYDKTTLNQLDRLKVNSYLALKYGVTLSNDNNNDGSLGGVVSGAISEGDYVASDGTTVSWDYSVNRSYHNDIAGIGRDDNSVLNQKQSKSVNEDAIVTIGLNTIATTNALNTNNFSNDKQFLIWGNNNAPTSYDKTITPVNPHNYNFRMNRVWRVEKTNFVDQNITLKVDKNTTNEIFLLISTDETFATTNTVHKLDANGIATFNSRDLPDGAYFTFGRKQSAPGGVTRGLVLWHKANDMGSTPARWVDLANGNDSENNNPASQAEFVSKDLNFNPAFKFSSGKRFRLANSGSHLPLGGTPRTATVIYEGGRNLINVGRAWGKCCLPRDLVGQYFGIEGNAVMLGWNVNYFVGGRRTPYVAYVDYEGTGGNVNNYSGLTVTSTRRFDLNTQPSNAYSALAAIGSGNTGDRPAGSLNSNGTISEIAYYNVQLTSEENQRVQSYTHLKYGLTLDQERLTNYIASDGTTIMWDATIAGEYKHDIAGIGRDDNSALSQKQSKSVNKDAIVTIGLNTIATTNALNTNNFSDDKQFLTWGNDDGILGLVTTELPAQSSSGYRLARKWFVQEEGDVGDLTIRFDNIPKFARRIELYVDDDGDFTNATIIKPTGGVVNGTVTFENVNLTDEQYFTIGYKIPSPGNVPAGLQLWLNAGVTVPNVAGNLTDWETLSGNPKFDFIHTGSDPERVENGINFNPIVVFDGNDFFRTAVGGATTNYTDSYEEGEVFTIVKGRKNSRNGSPYDFGGGLNSHYTWNNNYIYNDFGSSERKAWHPETKAVSEGGGTVTGSVVDVEKYHIYNTYSTTNDWSTYFDGELSYHDAVSTVSFSPSQGGNHVGAVAGHIFTGEIAEVVLYNRKLTDVERQRVTTYQAINSGITAKHNYVSSYYSGTAAGIVWDRTKAGGNYNHDIAGIGRDDASAINQKQSKSINEDAMVTMGLNTIEATNALNTSTFSNDTSYLIWGNNDGILGLVTTELPAQSSSGYRLARKWFVQEEGDVGDLTIRFDNIPKFARRIELYVDDDGDFTNATIIKPTGGVVNGTVTFENVNLTDEQYFTIGYKIPSPGNVPAGLQLWLNAGVTVPNVAGNLTDWETLSGNPKFDFIHTRSDPERVENGINFNPIVVFDGNDFFRTAVGGATTNYTDSYEEGEVFTIVKGRKNSRNGSPYDFGGGLNSHYTWNNNYIYNDFGSSERKAWHPETKAVSEGGGTVTGSVVDVEKYHIYNTYSTTNDWSTYFDGELSYHDAVSTVSFSPSQGGNHVGAVAGHIFTGEIAEVVLYNRKLTDVERQRVTTYQAINSGITAKHNYVSSYYSGTAAGIVWDRTKAGGNYNHDIAGIGRDDASAINQKQSKSINEDAMVTMGLNTIEATNALNTSTFSNDTSYLIWGNNDGILGLVTTELPAQSSSGYRLARKWFVQEEGDVGDLTIRFDNIPKFARRIELYVDDDGDFTNATIIKPTGGVVNGTVIFENVNLTDEQYFTIGYKIPAPGNVPAGLQLWLNAGITVPNVAGNLTDWETLSGNSKFDFIYTGSDPERVENGINFNPIVVFDGNDFFRTAVGGATTNYTDSYEEGEVFTIVKGRKNRRNGNPYDFGGGLGSRLNSHYAWYNNYIYNDFGSSERKGWHPETKVVVDGGGTVTGSVVDVEKYHIYNTYSATDDWSTYFDGELSYHDTASTVGFSALQGGNHVGATPGYIFTGEIAEVVLYNRKLTDVERQRVTTYQAINSGITAKHNYVSSYYSGTTAGIVWDRTKAGGNYNHDIAGIGRDDASVINQKQSKSINEDAMVTMGLNTIETTNALNTSAFTNDTSYLIWGNNDTVTSYDKTITPVNPHNYNFRMNRVWRVEKTNFADQNITLKVDKNTTSEVFLLISTDETFATTNTVHKLDANGIAAFNSRDLPDGAYFTFAREQSAPGGVTRGLVLWHKANDMGSTPARWVDLVNGNDSENNNPASQAEFVSKDLNFNPAFKFSSGKRFILANSGSHLPLGGTPRTATVIYDGGRNLINVGRAWGKCCKPRDLVGQYFGIEGDAVMLGWNVNYFVGGRRTPYVAYIDYEGTGGNVNNYSGLTVTSTRRFNLNTQPSNVNGALAAIGACRTGDPGGSINFNGTISEIAYYNVQLTSEENQRLQSYTHLKYGLTLDQERLTNYIASDGTTIMWDATIAGEYKHDIAGIGRDDNSALSQKQSKSVNEDAIVTIGLDTIATTNALNPNNFSDDKQFLTWGNDDGVLGLVTTELPAQSSSGYRLARKWFVQEKEGDVGDLTIRFNISEFARKIELYVDDDGDFTNATIIKPTGGVVNGTVTFENVNLTDEQYFTLGYEIPSPGNVPAGLQLWLNAGVTVPNVAGNLTDWETLSGNSKFDFIYTESDPERVENGINFNPIVVFDGNDFFKTAVGGATTNYTDSYEEGEVFTIVRGRTNRGNGGPYDFGGNTNSHYTWNNGYIHSDFGSTESKVWHPVTKVVTGGGGTVTGSVVDVEKYHIYNTYSTANDWSAYFDGELSYHDAVSTVSFSPSQGGNHVGAVTRHIFTGEIAEVVLYNRKLTDVERQRVTTYQAINSGITAKHNYVSSYYSGTTAGIVWDRTKAGGNYNHDIAGIGRDDASAINQKQSKSINEDAIVTMGLDTIATTNALNTNTFADDTSYLIWGNDDGVLELVTTELPAQSSSGYRLAREWFVQEKEGDVGDLTIRFDNISEFAIEIELYVDDDGDFTNATIIKPTGGVVNGTVIFENVNLTDEQYFTLGYKLPAPGNVSSGLQLWLNAGTTVPNVAGNLTDWETLSGNSKFDFIYTESDPERVENGINFNPIVVFDGNDFFKTAVGGATTNYTDSYEEGEVFTIVRGRTNRGNGGPYDFGGNTNSHYTWNNGYIHSDFGSTESKVWHPVTKVVTGGGGTVTGSVVDVEKYHIYNTYSTANDWSAYFDGELSYHDAVSTVSFSPSQGGNHVGAVTGHIFTGEIAEVVLYNRKLTDVERQRVTTYQAINSGITAKHNYVSSYYSGTTAGIVWDRTKAGGNYNHDIAGIGRDDASAINQKQSKSINEDAIVTMGLDTIATTNALNTNTFADDTSYLIWGNDDGVLELVTTELPAQSSSGYRLARKWFVQEKEGDVGDLTIRFDNISEFARRIELYVDDDGDFTNATIIKPTGGVVNGTVTFENVNLTDEQYFTIGYKIPAPGNVPAGLQLWLNAGVTVPNVAGNLTDWETLSGNPEFDFIQTGSDPERVENGINFNPIVVFDGNDLFRTAVGGATTNYTDSYEEGEVFTIVKGRKNRQNGSPYDFGGSGLNSHYTWNNGYIYNDFGSSERKAWHPVTKVVTEGGGTVTGSVVDVEKYHIYNTYSTANDWSAYFDGELSYHDAVSTVSFSPSQGGNHVGATAGRTFTGEIAEVVLYNRKLTDVERQRVTTYQAINSGITAKHNYVSSYYSGTTAGIVWDRTKAGGNYNHDIAGIGRDDASAINQKQSKSINEDAIVTMGLDTIATTNALNTNTFDNDTSYLIWGNNNADTLFNIDIDPINGHVYNLRMNRVWRVEKTSFADQNITLEFDEGDKDMFLVISADENFAITDVARQLNSNGRVKLNSRDLPDGSFFTFAEGRIAPGCITSNMALWLKADAETHKLNERFIWGDNSSNDFEFTSSNGPEIISNSLNFNPVLRFNAANRDFLTRGIMDIFRNPYSIFVVAHANAASQDFFTVTNTSDEYGIKIGKGINNNLRFLHRSPHAGNGGDDLEAGTLSDKHADLLSMVRTGQPIELQQFWINSADFQSMATTNTNAISGNRISIGREYTSSSTNSLDGEVAEIIIYSDDINRGTLRTQVESYLGVKYGITLGDTINPINYISGSGDTVWTADRTYQNNVFGIGREDCSLLDQRISRSIKDSILTISTDNNFTLANTLHDTIENDSEYLIIGNNAGVLKWTGENLLPSPGINRLERTWKVEKTSLIDTIYLSVDRDRMPNVPDHATIYLLVNKKDNLLTTDAYDKVFEMIYNPANKAWEIAYEFEDKDFFTFIIDYKYRMRHGKRFKFGKIQPYNK